MTELITTVRARYRRRDSYRGLSTLQYRDKKAGTEAAEPADTDESRKRGFLGLLRPQLQGVSKKLHEEINKLIDRRDKTLMQAVAREMPKIVGQNTARLQSDNQRAEKQLSDKMSRLEKRVELYTADTGAKFAEIQRELTRLRTAEKARTREEERIAYEQPIAERDERRRMKRETEREREELRREVDFELIKTERRITRKLRDEEEYEKRRRG